MMFWDITPLQQHAFPYYHFLGCGCLHTRFICQLKYDSLNHLLYSVADDGFIHAWNVPLIDPLNPQSKRNLTENHLCVFSLNHGKSANDVNAQIDNSVLFCDLSPDGQYLAAGTRSGTVFIWRLPVLTRDAIGYVPRVLFLWCFKHSTLNCSHMVSLFRLFMVMRRVLILLCLLIMVMTSSQHLKLRAMPVSGGVLLISLFARSRFCTVIFVCLRYTDNDQISQSAVQR